METNHDALAVLLSQKEANNSIEKGSFYSLTPNLKAGFDGFKWLRYGSNFSCLEDIEVETINVLWLLSVALNMDVSEMAISLVKFNNKTPLGIALLVNDWFKF